MTSNPTRASSRSMLTTSVGSAAALLAAMVTATVSTHSAVAGQALPFDPIPSAFERWLNSKRDWPNSEQRRFEKLSECSDQTVASSPYRMPVYTCLNGVVQIRRPGISPQACTIERVSYFPSNRQVRLWTSNCR